MSEEKEHTPGSLVPVVRGEVVTRSTALVRRGLALLELRQLTEDETIHQPRVQATAGDADALYSLGLMYAHGNGVGQDDTEAAKWFRRAADQGNASAQHYLAILYSEGKGVPQDHAEFLKWLRKAADQEHATSQYILGHCYQEGWSVPEDHAEAEKWYRKAADQGEGAAQDALEQLHELGHFVPNDKIEAGRLYRNVADQGNAYAQAALGWAYEHGEGVPADYVEAEKWYRKAANQGNTLAQQRLGGAYRSARGVPLDDVQAYMWQSLLISGLAAPGPREWEEDREFREDAVLQLERIAAKMTPHQIAEAQKLVRDWKPTKQENTALIQEDDEEDSFLLVLEHSSDSYLEVRIDPDAKTLQFYGHHSDYLVREYSTMEYAFRGERLFGRLWENRREIGYQDEEECNVRDGVVLESDIRKRKKPIGSTIEELIAYYSSEVAWHPIMRTDYRFFVMSKHPKLFPPRDLRTMIRAELERLRVVTDKVVAEAKRLGLQIEESEQGFRFKYPEGYPTDKEAEAEKYFSTLQALGTSHEELYGSRNLQAVFLALLGEA